MQTGRGNRIAAKLTAEEVAEMRGLYAGGTTQRELCQRFGISIGQVGRIVRGESWVRSTSALGPEEAEASARRLLNLQTGLDRLREEESRSAAGMTRELTNG